MYHIAIVGATGLVGRKLTDILDNMPNVRLKLFANESAGSVVQLKNRTAVVESCENLTSVKADCAMFMATDEVAAKYAPKLVRRGITCIDNSRYFRLRRDVPLVVPSVNGDTVRGKTLIANPNCSTIQTVIPINALKDLGPVRMLAVTYQSVSGAGKDALTDLEERRCYGALKAFRHPIYDNVIPMIGQLRGDGFTAEERKLTDESRKILSLPRLKVNAFCARVPVSVCHGVFVNLQLKSKINIAEIRDRFKNTPNVLLLDDAECGLYPMPLTLKGTKYVGVGRVTKDPTSNAVNFFCVADNLLRGAAYNAYEILLCKFREWEKCL